MINRMFGKTVEDKKEISCFANKTETKKIVELVNALQIKTDELKQISDTNGSGSLEYKKHTILSTILNHYKKITLEYDDRKDVNKDEDNQSLIIVLKKLYFIIKEIFDRNEEALKLFRNNDRERLINGLSYVYLSTVAAAFIFAPLSISASYIIGTQLLAASHDKEKEKQKELDFPVSYLLIKNIIITLSLSIENLNFSLNLKKLEQIPSKFISKQDNMLCPITSELMTNPVVCSLDGFSYEKSAITEWLTPHRTSPMTRKAMLPEQKVSDVLIPNTNLRQLIEDYKVYLKITAANETPAEQKPISPQL